MTIDATTLITQVPLSAYEIYMTDPEAQRVLYIYGPYGIRNFCLSHNWPVFKVLNTELICFHVIY
jgi:hypothetical protein